MSEVLTWSHDEADETGYGNAPPEGFTYMETSEGDQGRWSQHYIVVVKRDADETYWSFDFEQGLTEDQDGYRGADRYYGMSQVELKQVYPHRILTTVYLDKPWEV